MKYYYDIGKKGEVNPITCHEETEGEWRHSSTLSLIATLHEGGLLTPNPDPGE
jgi:hypothetical protein